MVYIKPEVRCSEHVERVKESFACKGELDLRVWEGTDSQKVGI